MKVCKFGGSSLADAGQISKVLDIVLADPARRMVVVSAPGKRNKSDTKVTDLLIALAEAALAKKDTAKPLKAVLDRYASIARDLKLGEYIEKTRRTHRPIIVTQNGKPTSILLNVIDWEISSPYEDTETLELLDDVRAAEAEIERGELYTSDEVRAMLKAERRL